MQLFLETLAPSDCCSVNYKYLLYTGWYWRCCTATL